MSNVEALNAAIDKWIAEANRIGGDAGRGYLMVRHEHLIKQEDEYIVSLERGRKVPEHCEGLTAIDFLDAGSRVLTAIDALD